MALHCSCSTFQDVQSPLSQLRELDSYERRRQNPSLTPLQVRQLQGILSNVDDEIHRYDEDIARLRGQIVFLENEKAELRRRAATSKSLLAPVRRLPVEVLSLILSYAAHAISSEVKWETDAHPTKPDTPVGVEILPLGWVCSQWREVALDTPAVWSTVHVRPSYASWEERAAAPAILATLLERSSQHPLTVYLYGDDALSKDDALFQLIASHSNRWHAAFVFTTTPGLDALTIIQGELATLTCVELRVRGPKPLPGSPPCEVFADAPSLREFRLIGLKTSQITFPWNQISHLELPNHHISHCLTAISQCPLLSSTVLCVPQSGSLYRMNATSAEALKELSVLYISPDFDGIDAFFQQLTSPGLTSLLLTSHQAVSYRRSWHAKTFFTFILRSSFSLTHFVLQLPMPESALLKLLRLLPSLISLTICDHHSLGPTITNGLLRHMNLREVDDAVVPHLEELDLALGRLTEDSVSEAALRSLVHSRYVPPAYRSAKVGLRRVALRGPVELVNAVESALQRLAGLTVVVMA